jgi:hypothetical protein
MMRKTSLTSALILVGGFCASAVIAADGVPEGLATARSIDPQSVVKNCGSIPKVSFAVTNGNESTSTTSTTHVDLAPLSVTFSIGGDSNTCLKVDLASMTYSAAGGPIFMRVLVDGVELAPGEVQMSGDDDEDGDGRWSRSHAASFYSKSVAPGSHTVKVQWRSYDGSSVTAHARSLGVHHK